MATLNAKSTVEGQTRYLVRASVGRKLILTDLSQLVDLSSLTSDSTLDHLR